MNPFIEMERMRRDMDRLTGGLFGRPVWGSLPSGVFPAVNISEDRDNFYIRAELPGMKSDDVSIEVVGRKLTISGERKILSEGDNVKYHRKEREDGKFSRVIELPGVVDIEKVEAKMVNGLLTVTVGKSEAIKPKQITIH